MTRVVFFGSPEVATRSLREAVAAGHDIAVVYTQPDRVVGRSKSPVPTPIKIAALELCLPVETPENLRDADTQAKLASFRGDAFLVVGYGQLLPPPVLEMPRLGVLNVHPSLLPRHRGPSPVATAILEGDTETGVTVMLLDRRMDTGPILTQSAPVPIGPGDTRGSLTARLFEIGAEMLVKTLTQWERGDVTARPQDEARATVTRLLKRADGEIDWSHPADRIERMVRAFDPWPGTFTRWDGRNLKVLAARLAANGAGKPGRVIELSGGLAIGCGSGALAVNRLQLEGRRAASAQEFLRGYPGIVGATLPS